MNLALLTDETSCMTSAYRNDATGHGALMANVAHEEERARHASCTTRLLEYGPAYTGCLGVSRLRSILAGNLRLSRLVSH